MRTSYSVSNRQECGIIRTSPSVDERLSIRLAVLGEVADALHELSLLWLKAVFDKELSAKGKSEETGTSVDGFLARLLFFGLGLL